MSIKNQHKLLLVTCKDRRKPLDLEEILHVKSDDCYCKVTMSSGVVYTLRVTLKSMEDRLCKKKSDRSSFVRIHNEHIISLTRVEFNRQQTVVYFKNGDWLPVGRKYYKELRKHLDNL